jgi:hypothetical protein
MDARNPRIRGSLDPASLPSLASLSHLSAGQPREVDQGAVQGELPPI